MPGTGVAIRRATHSGFAHGLAWLDRRAGVVVACFVIGLLGLGLAYSLFLGDAFRFADEHDYWDWASSIVSEFAYHRGDLYAYRPPGYPASLALVIAFDAPVWAARFVNFVLLAGAAVCLYDLGRRFARPTAGAVAACWLGAYPLVVYAAGTLYPQTLAGFLLLLAICLVTRRGARYAAAGGLVYAGLILVVPTFVALAPLLAIWLALRPAGISWRRPLLFCVVLALPVAGWSYRNHRVLDHWVFVSTNSGVNLALGNAPDTTPQSGVNVDLAPLDNADDLDEVQRSRAYRHAAMAWVGAHPETAAKLYLAKLAHYFAVAERLATRSQAKRVYTYILAVSYAPLLAVLIWRLVGFWWFRWRAIEALVIAAYLGFGVVMAVFFTRIRFRIPLDMLLLLVVGIAVTQLAEAIGRRRGPRGRLNTGVFGRR